MTEALAFLGPFVANHSFLSFFFFLLLFGYTFPVPEEIALGLVGVAARTSGAGYFEALVAAVPALIIADFGYYFIARLFGPRILRFRFMRRAIKPERIEEGERYFKRRGARILFFCRFIVGLRAPALLSAGFLRMPIKNFALYDILALLVATPVWLGVGYALGAQFDKEIGVFGRIISLVGPVAVIAAVAIIYRGARADRSRSEIETYEDKDKGASP
jgi:membrane protein DedA with SNARE-associated domain